MTRIKQTEKTMAKTKKNVKHNEVQVDSREKEQRWFGAKAETHREKLRQGDGCLDQWGADYGRGLP